MSSAIIEGEPVLPRINLDSKMSLILSLVGGNIKSHHIELALILINMWVWLPTYVNTVGAVSLIAELWIKSPSHTWFISQRYREHFC